MASCSARARAQSGAPQWLRTGKGALSFVFSSGSDAGLLPRYPAYHNVDNNRPTTLSVSSCSTARCGVEFGLQPLLSPCVPAKFDETPVIVGRIDVAKSALIVDLDLAGGRHVPPYNRLCTVPRIPGADFVEH